MPFNRRRVWIAAASAFVAVSTGCAPSNDRLERLARSGNIQENAPIKADASIEVAAPQQRLWSLLAGIDQWPRWQPDIDAAALHGSLSPGSQFTWRSGGTSVRSKLALVEPITAISWTGQAFGLEAVHVWTFTALPSGRVLVRTRESMDGFPISVLYPSAKLQESDVRWLASLKRVAEAK